MKILIPLPSYGFDPTEAAIPWKILKSNNIDLFFATPFGKKSECDRIILTGEKLGIFKSLLQARKDAVEAYNEMSQDPLFSKPYKYAEIDNLDFDGLLLPGGHDKGVKEYLESNILHNLIAKYFLKNKPVAAICHGVVVVARSINPNTNQSVLYNYKTTSLLKSQELGAYNLTKMWLGDYYLTYPEITVEDEVKSVLVNKENYLSGSLPMLRDTPDKLSRGFIVQDKNYLSARWPGDAYNFSFEFLKMLK